MSRMFYMRCVAVLNDIFVKKYCRLYGGRFTMKNWYDDFSRVLKYWSAFDADFSIFSVHIMNDGLKICIKNRCFEKIMWENNERDSFVLTLKKPLKIKLFKILQ